MATRDGIIAHLESLRLLDLLGRLLPIPIGQLGAETLRHRLVAVGEVVAHLPAPVLLLGRIGRQQVGRSQGAALVELRFQRVEGVQLFRHHGVDRHGDVRLKRVGLLERVGVEEEHRVALQRRDVGADERHGDHVGGVLNQDARVAVIGVVVVGTMAHDDVRLPFADEPGDQTAILQRGQQFAVVNVQHFGGDAQDAGTAFHLRLAPAGEGPSGVAPVADVAVGHGNELDVMSLGRPQGRHAARL
jgi:hypothetical protein